MMVIRRLLNFCKTCWLFTASDIIMMCLPNIACGLLIPCSTEILKQPVDYSSLVKRSHLVISWVWLHLLSFNIANQTRRDSLIEDRVNKPWRPIPSGRISLGQAKSLGTAVRGISLAFSFVVGGFWASIAISVLTYWYNHLGGGDVWHLRNVINACGFICFLTGAMQALDSSHVLRLNGDGMLWYALILVVISSTIQVQDMYDQEGDRLMGRQTIPLVFGDRTARWTIALPVLCFSLGVPILLNIGVTGLVISLLLGAQVAVRALCNTEASIRLDKLNAKAWSVWITWLYLLPSLK